jgi:hypothetical protein
MLPTRAHRRPDDHQQTALSAHDPCIGSSENEPTLPDAAVAGDHDHHGLSCQEPYALSLAPLEAERAVKGKRGQRSAGPHPTRSKPEGHGRVERGEVPTRFVASVADGEPRQGLRLHPRPLT